MSHAIHDDEPDTSEVVVRSLLSSQCPLWSDLPVQYLETSGTDNAMWRVQVDDGRDVVVRLPRRSGAAEGVLRETALLEHLGRSMLGSVVATPGLLHVGNPQDTFPHHWSVLGWLEGSDAWSSRDLVANHLDQLATDLGEAVVAFRTLADLPVPVRSAFSRGGPIGPLIQRLERWLDDPTWQAEELIDVERVRRLAAAASDVPDATSSCFLHGDLIPGNLLVDSGRLSAIIDWGGAGYGDPAQDLAPAWSVFNHESRLRFRSIVGGDDATWIRARTIELEHAVGGVLYYVPRGHPLGDVMARTLQRILDDE